MPPRYVNTVPQGIAGTGNATIFGDNPVAAQFGNQLAAMREREFQDELLAEKKAEALAKLMRDNQLAASEGRLWAKDIGALEQDHFKKGAALMQKGVNPYGSSPEALEYQQERRAVQAQQGFRKATETQFNELDKLISANPDKYDPASIKELHDFFSGTKLSDAYSKNLGLPQLRERFNTNEFLKGVGAVKMETKDQQGNVVVEQGVVDVPATENVLLGTLGRDPKGQQFLAKMTSGFPLNELKTFSSDASENQKNMRRMLAENYPLRAELARSNGIRPFSKEYDDFIDQAGQAQAQAKKKFDSEMRGLVGAASEGLTLYDKRTQVKPDLSEETLAERIRHNRAMENRPRAGAQSSTVTDERRNWVQGIINADPQQLDRLVAAGNAKEGYDKKDSFKIISMYDEKGNKIPVGPRQGKVKFHVPAKTKLDSYGQEIVVTPANTYVINLADPNIETFLNQLIGDVTGAYVDLGSTGAKSANLKKSPPLTPAKAAPKATAPTKVTDSEFQELLKRAKALKIK